MCSTSTQAKLARYLPDDVEHWTREQEQVYTPQTLYNYIDGGAELYLSYNFRQMVNRVYSRPGQPDLQVDLFDMGTSREAFGVFSHSREAVDTAFGQGSQYVPGLLLFWKDRYYISILASPETDESRAAMHRIAATIDQRILSTGPLPDILEMLPGDSLVHGSIRYFHHHIWLNSYYYITEDNILDIDGTTDALLAKYGSRGHYRYLLLVRYPDASRAEAAHQNFRRHYLPEGGESSIIQIEDGTFTGCQVTGRYFAAVLGARKAAAVHQLLTGIQTAVPAN